ncbi:MAG: ATP-binding protein [Burkholderiales bacterium]
MKHVLAMCVALGIGLLYLLWRASANTALFAQNYTLLLVLNGVLVFLLSLLIARQLFGLRAKLKARLFGAKLTLRLLSMFALVALLPGLLVYGVSVQFLTKSIESWFDVRVDNALEGGLNLGRSALDNLLLDINRKSESMAFVLGEQTSGPYLVLLNKLREQYAVEEAALFDSKGGVVAFSKDEQSGLIPDIPEASVLRRVRANEPYREIEPIPDKGLYLRVIVPVNSAGMGQDTMVLQLLQSVPRRLEQDAEAVQAVYRDYQELSLSRQGLNKIFSLTLTLTLLLALLSAIALAFVLSERLSAPLSFLAKGTRAVAEGDFSQQQPVQSHDELGALMQSFNTMTRQLADARTAAEFNHQQSEAAKAYLESVLAHLSSGVLALDAAFRLSTANLAAAQILDVDLAVLLGARLSRGGAEHPALAMLAQTVEQRFQSSESREWQQQLEYIGKAGTKVFLVRGTRLPVDDGYVVVFDDVTQLLQAQRAAAWGEVARRLAHEIKNPLTPIQLSAERLEQKLRAKLDQNDAEVLTRATNTIVNQVAALKGMVNAFAEYARAPQLDLHSLDLNRLVREVLMMYESAPIQLDLSPDLPPVRGDIAALRQVIHNLLQNAQDALHTQPQPRIAVCTRAEQDRVRLTIEDNGSGFPEETMSRVFEPYVTGKPKGTGLGLAIVKKIVEEHHGSLRITNLSPHGATVDVLLPMAEAA